MGVCSGSPQGTFIHCGAMKGKIESPTSARQEREREGRRSKQVLLRFATPSSSYNYHHHHYPHPRSSSFNLLARSADHPLLLCHSSETLPFERVESSCFM